MDNNIYKQRYTSDCSCCKFIKRGINPSNERDCDIFVTTSSERCVVFRYSNEPSDNSATGIFYILENPNNYYNSIVNDNDIMNNFKKEISLHKRGKLKPYNLDSKDFLDEGDYYD